MRFGMMAAAAACMMAAPASAAVALRGYGAVASDFVRFGTSAAPLPVVQSNGVRFLLFSPNYAENPTSDFEISGVEAYADGPTPLLTTYNVRYTAALDRIVVFGAAAGEALTDSEDDVLLVIENAFAPLPTVSVFQVTSASAQGGFWEAQSRFAAIPEPATWALMIAGFGMVGAATRRRTRIAYS